MIRYDPLILRPCAACKHANGTYCARPKSGNGGYQTTQRAWGWLDALITNRCGIGGRFWEAKP